MKNIYIFLAAIIIISFLSCSRVINEEMTVIRDCTGTYLRFNGEDYNVCNSELLTDIETGSDIKASFKKIDMCSNSVPVCYMLHANKGWVEITKIK